HRRGRARHGDPPGRGPSRRGLMPRRGPAPGRELAAPIGSYGGEFIRSVLVLFSLLAMAVPAWAQAPSAGDLARGKYIYGATGRRGGHTLPKGGGGHAGR